MRLGSDIKALVTLYSSFPCSISEKERQVKCIEKNNLGQKQPLSRCRRRGRGPGRVTDRKTITSVTGDGIVIVGIQRLHKAHDVEVHADAFIPGNQRSNEKDEEQNQHSEIQNRKSDNSSLAELRLLQRVDGRANLTTVDTLVKLR